MILKFLKEIICLMNYYNQQDKKSLINAFFKNNMSADIKLSKTQISKIIQSGGFLGSLLSKIEGPLMKVAVPFAKKYFSSIRNNSCCISN